MSLIYWRIKESENTSKLIERTQGSSRCLRSSPKTWSRR